jgi:ribosomal protein L37E
MSKRRKDWVDQVDDKKHQTVAVCLRCGARSTYRVLTDWKSFYGTSRTRSLSFFDWWNGFKQHHAKCVERTPILSSEDQPQEM